MLQSVQAEATAVSKLCKHAAMLVCLKVPFGTHAGLHLEEVNMLHLASLLCVDGVLGNIHEGLGCNGGSGRDACTGEQVLFHQVHPPHQQVGIAHGAAPHAAVHLNQAGPPACILQLHMEYSLHHTCSSRLLPNTLSVFTLSTQGFLVGCTVSCFMVHTTCPPVADANRMSHHAG